VYGGATSEDPRTNQAVEATRGQVLTYQGGIARCVYSAVCGGHTENNEDVWDVAPLPYLRGQPDFDPAAHPELRFPLSGQALADFVANPVDTYCRQPEWSKPEYFRWQVTKSRSELEQALAAAGVRVGSLLALEPLARGVSGRIKSLVVQGSAGQATLGPEYTIRKALGGLRSSNFVASVTTGSDGLPACFTFTGAGWGHGVGMCQIGAVGLAAAGADYRAILARYFPGTTLSADWQIVGGRWRMGR
jgi:SpoIID/LytB domain protein